MDSSLRSLETEIAENAAFVRSVARDLVLDAEDAEDEAQRSKMRVSASRLALAGAAGGAAPAALATEEEGVFT